MLGKILNYIGDVFGDKDKNNKFDGLINKEETDNSVFADTKENNVNGKIDEPFYQGKYGDCWLLSGILAMSYNESGAEIIQESINANADGSIDMYFPGIDKSYSITADELAKENKEIDDKSKYSRGDDDVLAIELGVEKIVADQTVETKYSIQNGGNPYYTFKLYGAENVTVADTKEEISGAFEHFSKNPNNCSMTLGVTGQSVCGLRKNHGYTVKDVTKSSVVIVDPWDSEKEIEVNKKKLLKSPEALSVVYAEFAT